MQRPRRWFTRSRAGRLGRAAAAVLTVCATPAVLADLVTVNGGGVFIAEGANQWGAGPATQIDVGYATDPLFLGFDFDTGNFGFDGIAGSEPFAFGVGFDGRFAGRAGLEIGYYFDSGSVDARYPFGFDYQYLDTPGIENQIKSDPGWNRRFDLAPSFTQAGDTWLSTNFPEVGAYVDTVLEFQGKAVIEGCVFGCVDVNLVPGFLRDVDERQSLFAFNAPDPVTGQPDGQLSIMGFDGVAFERDENLGGQPKLNDPSKKAQSGKAGGGAGVVVKVENIGFGQPITASAGFGYGPFAVTTELAEMTLSLPEQLDMQASADTSTPVTRLDASAGDEIADLKLDMDALLSSFVPFLPPGGVTVDMGIASLDLLLFDYKLGPALELDQAVSLAPEPTLSLDFDQRINVLKNGNIERTDHVDVRLGEDSLAIQFPNRELNITPEFSLNPKFENDLDLDLSLNSRLEALGLGADFFGVGGFDIGPLYTREDELARTKLADLVNTRFDLAGRIEDAVNLNLQPFTLGEGWRLSGEAEDLPRYASEVRPDGSASYGFRFDPTDLGAGPEAVKVSYFGSAEDSYRDLHYFKGEKCGFWFIGCLDWDTTLLENERNTVYAQHHGGLPSDPLFRTGGNPVYQGLNGDGSLGALPPDQTPLVVCNPNDAACLAGLVPDKFQDEISPRQTTYIGNFARWTTEDRTYYSDLVDQLDSTRYGGFGLTDPVFLAFDLAQTLDEGDDRVTRFADALVFDIGDFVDNASGYEFESLLLPNDYFVSLLDGIGDSDGLTLELWDDGLGDWSTLTSWTPTVGGDDFRFNFFDDYLLGLLGSAGAGIAPQDTWSTDGTSRFRIGDLDFGLTGFDPDTLLDRFGAGGDSPFIAGFTVTDLVSVEGRIDNCFAFIGVFIGCDTPEGPKTVSDWTPLPMPSTLGSDPQTLAVDGDVLLRIPDAVPRTYAGTEETIHDPTQADSPGLDFTIAPDLVEIARSTISKPPVEPPETGLGDYHQAPVPEDQVPGEGTPTCTAGDCDSTPLAKTDPDGAPVVVTGTGFQELVDKGYVNPTGESHTGQHRLEPPADLPPLGSHSLLALSPTEINTSGAQVFDFERVDFGGPDVWGGPLDYTELVFRASNTLSDGTGCGSALPGLSDGQVVDRTLGGMSNGYVPLDTGSRNAAQVAGCFDSVDPVSRLFGTEAPVFLELAFAPSYDLMVEGSLFTSLFLPVAGADALPLEGLIDVLLFDENAGDYVFAGSIGLGDLLLFDTPTERIRLTGLHAPNHFLDHDPSLYDLANPSFVIGLTLTEAGTVITAQGSGFPSSTVPEAPVWALLIAGLLACPWRRPVC